MMTWFFSVTVWTKQGLWNGLWSQQWCKYFCKILMSFPVKSNHCAFLPLCSQLTVLPLCAGSPVLFNRWRWIPDHVQSEGRLEQGEANRLIFTLTVVSLFNLHTELEQRFLSSAGGNVLQRRWPLLDVRSLQQLFLQPQAVIRLPVGVWTDAQQRSRSCTQRSVCGENINFTLGRTRRIKWRQTRRNGWTYRKTVGW